MPNWDQILQLAPLALMQPGSPEGAAFMRGLLSSQQRIQQQRMQEQQFAGVEQERQARMANMEADNARQNQSLEMQGQSQALQRLSSFYNVAGDRAGQVAETATDPVAGNLGLAKEMTGLAGAFGVDPSVAMPLIPNLNVAVSGRKKKRAGELYTQAEKRFGPEAMANDAITIQTEEFGPIKPSALRAMFEAPATDASGAPAPPLVPPKPTQILDLGGAKTVVDPTQLRPGMTFRDVPVPSTAQPQNEPLVAIVGPDGQPVLVPRSQAAGQRPAAGREQGRQVLSSDANRIAELDTSLTDLKTLKTTLSAPGATGARAKVGAMVPSAVTEFTGWGMSAKQRQATIDRVKQVIGKALEGGVLRREDEYKYVKILPTIQDPPDVAASKLTGLELAIQQRRQNLLDALRDANYDVGRYEAGPSGGIKILSIEEVK